ncbi:MAG: transglycosylase SLT domain-containing protein [Fibrobacteres bacterium]|nr:transglycosylase SLT domain-containing protein [Fibrobacterota bacterium]
MLTSIQPQVTSTVKDNSGYREAEIRKVAKQFEAMFAGIMLKTMNESIERSSLVKKSMGESIFQDMLMDEYANKMSEGRGMGLADVLYRSISGSKESIDQVSGKVRDYNSKKYATKALQYTAGNFSGVKVSPLKESLKERMENLAPVIDSAAERYGVSPSLVKAVVRQESGGNASAVSKSGAKGVMQLMDGTAKDMGVRNVYNPVENINGGVKYLRKMLDMFNGDEKLALAAYNAGPDTVKKWNGVPPFAETENYVKNVTKMAKEGDK